MNPDTLNQISRAVDDHLPSDDALINQLAAYQPQARADFANQLEAQLLTQLKGQTMYPKPTQGRVALPLVAALMLMLLFGGVFTLANQGPQVANQPEQAATDVPIVTATPTVAATIYQPFNTDNLIPVLVAVQDIPRNTLITGNMVMTVYWTRWVMVDGVDFSATEEQPTTPADVAGRYSRQFIPQWQPITASLIDTVENITRWELPPYHVAVTIPYSQAQQREYPLPNGTHVDILADMLFVDVMRNTESAAPAPKTLRIVQNAEVLIYGEQTIGTETTSILTLAVKTDEAEVLTWAIDSQMPLTVIRASKGILPREGEPVGISDKLPAGYTTLELPYVEAGQSGYPMVEVGAQVEVVAGTVTVTSSPDQVSPEAPTRLLTIPIITDGQVREVVTKEDGSVVVVIQLPYRQAELFRALQEIGGHSSQFVIDFR